MTDFLTSLASRTLGLTPVAEPLIAPIFAVDPLRHGIAADKELLEIPQAAQEPVLYSVPAMPPELPPSREERAGQIAAEARPARSPDAAQEMAAPVVHKTPVASAPDILTPASQAPHQHPAFWMAGTEAPTARQDAEVRHVAAAEPPLTTASVPPAHGNPPLAVAAQPAASSAALAGSAAPPVRSAMSLPDVVTDEPLLMPLNPAATLPARRDLPAAVHRSELVATPTLAERAVTARHSAHGASAAAPGPPALSTIEITIGRVEVRAVHPPAPAFQAKPTSPAAPALSLEEYLRNQNGGRR